MFRNAFSLITAAQNLDCRKSIHSFRTCSASFSELSMDGHISLMCMLPELADTGEKRVDILNTVSPQYSYCTFSGIESA